MERFQYNSNLNSDDSSNSINQSMVDFNNSKNFSIYKNNNREEFFTKETNASQIDEKKSDESFPYKTTFNDRLNQIDLK